MNEMNIARNWWVYCHMYDIWTNKLNFFLFFNCSGRIHWDFWASYCFCLQIELMVYMGIYINCLRVSKYFPDIFFLSFHTSLAFSFIYSTFKYFLQGQLHYAHNFAVTQKIDHLVTVCKGLVPHLTLFWASVLVRSVLIATSNWSTDQLSDSFISGFSTKLLYKFLIFPTCAVCFLLPTIFVFTTLIELCEIYTLWSPLLCNSLHSPFTSPQHLDLFIKSSVCQKIFPTHCQHLHETAPYVNIFCLY